METIISKIGKDKLIKLYIHLRDELIEFASKSGVSDLEKYFKPDIVRKQNYLEILASSLQNSGQMRNSIKFNDSEFNHNKIQECLYDFDAKEAKKHYASGDEIFKELTDKNIETMRASSSEDNQEPKKKWKNYCKGLYQGLVYLTNEKNNGTEQIKRLVASGYNLPDEWERTKYEIQKAIHGLGPALVCDWLKECGCEWLAKPDTHIIEVLKSLTNEKGISEKKVVNFMADWSKFIRDEKIDDKCSPYKLDKIIWLLCTGEFYLDRPKYGRDNIIDYIGKSL